MNIHYVCKQRQLSARDTSLPRAYERGWNYVSLEYKAAYTIDFFPYINYFALHTLEIMQTESSHPADVKIKGCRNMFHPCHLTRLCRMRKKKWGW